MTPTVKKVRLMPEVYYRIGDVIIHSDSYNFMVSDVHLSEKGKYVGQEQYNNTTYHADIRQVVKELCLRTTFKYFPDLEVITYQLKNIETKLEEIINLKKP